MVEKFANLTFNTMVRPINSAARSLPATFSLNLKISFKISAASSKSLEKVSSLPILFSGSYGSTDLSSRPHDNSCKCSANPSPNALLKVFMGKLAISETLNKPKRAKTSSVFPPTPQSAPTGKGCRKSITSAGETTINPSGFALVEASLAINFVGAIPTEQVIFS